jgi:hypothetical protein
MSICMVESSATFWLDFLFSCPALLIPFFVPETQTKVSLFSKGSCAARSASAFSHSARPHARRDIVRRYWVKCNLWIFIFGWVGNYFWTHYFYVVLGAK